MAISQAICNSFKKELLEGVHDFSSDIFKLALYVEAADLGADTTAYSATDEAVGGGYAAGGQVLTVSSGYPQVSSGRGLATFDMIEMTNLSFTCKGALIYNASKANRAVMVLDFGSDQTILLGSLMIDFSSFVAGALIQIS